MCVTRCSHFGNEKKNLLSYVQIAELQHKPPNNSKKQTVCVKKIRVTLALDSFLLENLNMNDEKNG